jgi:pyruvate/oxaloacetate carboxyltransferase
MAYEFEVTDAGDARKNSEDIVVFGDEKYFILMHKMINESKQWVKSIKAMQVPGGCLVQVTTQQSSLNGTDTWAEALTFVPGVALVEDPETGGCTLRKV